MTSKRKYLQAIYCADCKRIVGHREVGGGPNVIEGCCSQCMAKRFIKRMPNAKSEALT